MPQMFERKLIKPMVISARIERIGNKHRIFNRRDLYAVSRQYQEIIFHIMRNFKN